jgi:AcrR family transcriptional regulator
MASKADALASGNRRRTLRDEQKQFTQQRILDAARQTFSRLGYVATTMDDIAVAAGASRATVYLHFAGKLEIFTALAGALQDGIRERYQDLDRVLESRQRGDLREWFAREIAWFQANRDLLPAWDQVVATEPGYRVVVRADLASIADSMPKYLARWGESRRAEAQLRIDLLLVQLERFFTRSAIQETFDADLGQAADILTSIWFPALQPPSPS